jgi:TolA-binding protein
MAEKDIHSADAQDSGAVQALAAASSTERPSRFRIVVVALLLLNTAIVAFVGSVLLGVLSGAPGPSTVQGKSTEPSHAQPLAESRPAPTEAIDPAVSWRRAEKAFGSGDYKSALDVYRSLWKISSAIPSETNITDYLLFRQCQCLRELGDAARTRELLAGLVRSDSPVVRGAASCLLATYEARDGAHLQARQTAYSAIAALGATERTSQMLADCEFLIARSLTENVFSLSNRPAVPFKPLDPKDPFADLDEQSLRRLLQEGAMHLKGASLGPTIQKLPGLVFVKKYSAACAQTSLEDFLDRLAAEAGVEVKWESVSPAARQRAVTLAFREATHQQLAEVACGMAGLVARFTGSGVEIHDPVTGGSSTQQRELLCAEAMSAWRRAFLRFGADPRISEGHFSLAGLYECAEDKTSAIGEYRLTVTRFPRSEWAPESLMQSARSRVSMGDFTGAHTDLADLLDSYPGYRFSDRAYLELGSVTLKAGKPDEAVRCFLKLYHLNLSPRSRSEAALGLGQCYRQKANYVEAAKWLTAFTTSARDVPADRLAGAYLMLGECESTLGNTSSAVEALRSAIDARGGRDMDIRASLELARQLLKSEQYAAALACLHRLEAEPLTDSQSYAFTVLSAQVLRAAGLPDRATALLKDKLTALNDPQLRALAAVELARCRADAGDLAAARTLLAEALPQMESGPAAWEAACDLAQVCLRNGQHEQAIAVARELLKTKCSDEIARKARGILSSAYLSQHDYKNAAAAVSSAAPAPSQGERP